MTLFGQAILFSVSGQHFRLSLQLSCYGVQIGKWLLAKIKLTSIARDTYVTVDGYGQTKINHAYAYEGPELAIKTINENFDMNIQGFVTVNFSQLAEIIDY